MISTKHVFIVGSGPLPNDHEGIREAAGLRTQQFADALQEQGHRVSLVCIHNNPQKKEQKQDIETIIWRTCRTDKTLFRQLRHLMSKLKPDVVIGVNTFPCFAVSQTIDNKTPFWADLNGWIMAEAQARSWSEQTNVHFANAWKQEKAILKRADKISCVSENQKFCTIGELAALGHFRHDNFLEKRVYAIENCTKWFDIDRDKERDMSKPKEEGSETQRRQEQDNERKKIMFETKVETRQRQFAEEKEKTRDIEKSDTKDNEETKRETQKIFRGIKVPKDAFVVAWIGGYNNWVDEESLFVGLEMAMANMANLYFVSTGGAIAKVADDTFGRFRKRIAASAYKERFIFLGWIDTQDMKKIYAESDVGINIDIDCIETETGARNRINEMMKFGLPVITTNGSEIGKKVGEWQAGISLGYENLPSELSKSIQRIATMTKEEKKQMGENGQKYIFTDFPGVKVMEPVLSFVANAHRTNTSTLAIEGMNMMIQNAWWYAKKNGIKTLFAKIIQRFL